MNSIDNSSSKAINNWLDSSTKKLLNQGVDSARLDCLLLLEKVTSHDRASILAHPEVELSKLQLIKLNRLLKRRMMHEPIGYILQKAEFYGRNFMVNNHTLVPRPETETIIELLLEYVKNHVSLDLKNYLTVIDIGTGSGCLAITAKLEIPKLKVLGIDISSNCLKIAKKNAMALGSNIQFLKGDLLAPVKNSDLQPFTIILANLPYVPTTWQINDAAKHEPKLAIYGGQDGLDIYRSLFDKIAALTKKPAAILTESMPPQHKTLRSIAASHGYRLNSTRDFVQLYINIH